jgi:hypothetical protein
MGSILPAVSLYIFVSMFSPGAEANSRWKILVIALSAAFIGIVAQQIFPSILGSLLAIALSLGVIALALMFWCKIDGKATAKILAAYWGVWFAIAIVGTFLHA